jgi:hypothetical protein
LGFTAISVSLFFRFRTLSPYLMETLSMLWFSFYGKLRTSPLDRRPEQG